MLYRDNIRNALLLPMNTQWGNGSSPSASIYEIPGRDYLQEPDKQVANKQAVWYKQTNCTMPSKEYWHQGEEEREPTPQQLNAEMNALYDQLPRVVVQGEWDRQLPLDEWLESPAMDKWVEEIERREDSKHKEMLMERLTSCTHQASITSSFREFIEDQYSRYYNRGFEPEEEQEILEQEFFFLDRGHPESGGIFDPKRAVQFEYQALAREKNLQLSSVESKLMIEGMTTNAHRLTEALGLPREDMPMKPGQMSIDSHGLYSPEQNRLFLTGFKLR